jgi:Amt family ammonium transporter
MGTGEIDAGHTAWILMSCALVNFMTPGLAFFYGGLVRRNHVLSIIIQNYVCMGIITLIWVVWGFSLCFGGSGRVIGDPRDFAMLNRVTGQPLPHEGRGKMGEAYVEGIPGLVFCAYQGMFAVITPALMTGAFAERIKFGPFLVFVVLWIHFVYFPWCHWVWGPNGWLMTWGVVDFAGGLVVHVTAGFSALATVVALPSREKLEGAKVDKTPHNVPYVALGTALLWFGWFGFNGGSALGADEVAAYALINTEISASVALLVWMCIEWKLEGKPSLVGVCVGAIAGLVMITPAAGFVKPWAAVVIGTLSAVVCYACTALCTKLGLDDALDVWGVHGMGGFLGTCLVGVLAEHDVNGITGDWNQFKKQLAAALLCAVYSFVMAYGMIKGMMAVTDIVPDREAVKTGLDYSMHGMLAHNDEDDQKVSKSDELA